MVAPRTNQRFRPFALIVMLVLAAAPLVPAQEPVPPKLTPTIITATKQVALFTSLEIQQLQAVRRKDKAALEAMLADDFEIAMPKADPLTGEDWVDSVMARDFNLKSFAVRQMSVADMGESAVV